MTAAAPTTPAMVPMIVTHDTRSIKRIMSSVEQPGRTLAVNPAPLASRRCALPAGDRLSAQRPIARIGQAWQGPYSVLLEECEIVNLSGWLTLVTFHRAVKEHCSGQRRRSPARSRRFERGAAHE